MKVFFDKEYLLELYRDGKTRDKHHRYQPSIVKKYQKIIQLMVEVKDIRDLQRQPSMHYEQLSGNYKGLSSVRVDRKYRIVFREECEENDVFANICFIDELSNHYQ